MQERPIIFSGEMVRAILDGRKTQTRRALNPQPKWRPDWGTAAGMDGSWVIGSPAALGLRESGDHWLLTFDDDCRRRFATEEAYGWGAGAGCPYGQPGDRLWVREAWRVLGEHAETPTAMLDHARYGFMHRYRADEPTRKGKWRPSIFMPRWASRILLEIASVRVEQLQAITEANARAEGVAPHGYPYCAEHSRYRMSFARLWDSINRDRATWASNPFVWVIEFKQLDAAA